MAKKLPRRCSSPGRLLRFGQVELKIDDGLPVPTAAPAPAPVAAPVPAAARGPEAAAPKKSVDGTMVIPRGVSLNDLEQSGVRPAGFDTNTAFSKKTNKANTYFIIGGVVVFLVILVLIGYLIKQAGGSR